MLVEKMAAMLEYELAASTVDTMACTKVVTTVEVSVEQKADMTVGKTVEN
jgi:hypothetical protein